MKNTVSQASIALTIALGRISRKRPCYRLHTIFLATTLHEQGTGVILLTTQAAIQSNISIKPLFVMQYLMLRFEERCTIIGSEISDDYAV